MLKIAIKKTISLLVVLTFVVSSFALCFAEGEGQNGQGQKPDPVNLSDYIELNVYPNWVVNGGYGKKAEYRDGMYIAPKGSNDVMILAGASVYNIPLIIDSFSSTCDSGIAVSQMDRGLHVYQTSTNSSGNAVVTVTYRTENDNYIPATVTFTVHMEGGSRSKAFKSSYKNLTHLEHVYASYENGVFSDEIELRNLEDRNVYVLPMGATDCYVRLLEEGSPFGYISFEKRLFGDFTVEKLPIDGGKSALHIHLNETDGNHECHLGLFVGGYSVPSFVISMGYGDPFGLFKEEVTEQVLDEPSKEETASDIDVVVEEPKTEDTLEAKEIVKTDFEIIKVSDVVKPEVSDNTTEKIDKKVFENKDIAIKVEDIQLSFNKDASNAIAKSGSANVQIVAKEKSVDELSSTKTLQLKNLEVEKVYSLEIKAEDKNVTSFGDGTVQVSIPFDVPKDKDASKYVVYYVKDDGSLELMPTKYVDGNIIFETTHFSDYAIVYEENIKTDEFPLTKNNIFIVVMIALILFGAVKILDRGRLCKSKDM